MKDFVRSCPSWALTSLVGIVGGLLAQAMSFPLPWLIGSLVAVAAASLLGLHIGTIRISFPQRLRRVFIPVVGVTIGCTFDRGMVQQLLGVWVLLVFVPVFIVVALALNYRLFRYFGRYDVPTAFFSSSPGGLVESVLLGENAGGNMALLSLHQFLRLALVIVAVPTLFFVVEGDLVGSAAGLSLGVSKAPLVWHEAIILLAAAVVGALVALRLRIPAAVMIGPIALTVILNALGLLSSSPPDWLLYLAQLVIGICLGVGFSTINPGQVLIGLRLSLISVGGMIIVSGGLAFLAAFFCDTHPAVLFLSFMPGGLIEMGLIALTLDENPLIVTASHLFRLTLTVLLLPRAYRLIAPKKLTVAKEIPTKPSDQPDE